MLDDKIKDHERLYKAIKLTVPHHWKFDVNRPSSAVFKDSKGVSVDRGDDRDTSTIISNFQIKFKLKAVVSLTAEQCRDKNTHPVARPFPDNPYHAEIHRSPDVISLTNGQARSLSKLAKIDYLSKE